MPASKKAIDFTNVKESGNFRPRHKAEGDYTATVVDVEDATSNSGNEQWVFAVKIEGDERSLYPVYCGRDDKQAWKIRKMLIGAGMSVPKRRVMVDPNRLIGKTLGVTLEDDEYEGRMRSKIVDFLTPDEVVSPGEDSEDEVYERSSSKKTAPAARKKAAPPVEDDEEELDEDTDDEDTDDLDEAHTTPPRRAAKKAATKRRAPEPEDEEEEEEVEEAPAPRRAAKKAAPATKATARRRPPVEEEEEDLDLDEL